MKSWEWRQWEEIELFPLTDYFHLSALKLLTDYHMVLHQVLLHLFFVQFISVPLCYKRIHKKWLDSRLNLHSEADSLHAYTVNYYPTDPAGRSCHSIQAGRGTGNLQEPPDTSLQGRMGSDHSASQLRMERRKFYMNYWSMKLECVSES